MFQQGTILLGFQKILNKLMFLYFIMKYAIIILCTMTILCKINAQTYFSKLFDVDKQWESIDKILTTNEGKIFYVGRSVNFFVNDSSIYRKLFVTELDNNFEINKIIYLRENYRPYTSASAIKNLNSTIVYGKNDSIITNFDTYYLSTISNNLFVSNTHKLNFFQNTTLTSEAINYNNKLYFFCADYTTFVASKLKLSMQCMDTNGNLLWGKVFQDKRCYTINATQTKDGNFILAGLKYYGEGLGGDDSAFAWYAKVDTMGTILWEHVLDRGSPFYADDFWVSNANDNYYLTGTLLANHGLTPYDLHNDSSYCVMAKINENNGEIIWHKQMFTNRERIQDLYTAIGSLTYKNGGLYGLLTHNVTNGSNQYVMFAKFDMEGNILWKRLFQQADYSNRAYSLTPIADGFLICGDAKDSTHTKGDSDAWLIKTDTNGCIIPNCNAKDGLVQIINPERILTVFPNPAQNEINIETIGKNIQLSSFEVYNLLGQILLTQTAQNINASTINTETLNNGTYLIVITLTNGSQAVKKVVISH
jgi:hypothetical protein